jgi:hypothetical protein
VVTLCHEHVDIAEDRVRLDVDLGGGASGLRQVDGHVAQERDRDQLILDIPGSRSLALPSGFKDRVQGQEPPAAPAYDGLVLGFKVAVHGVTRPVTSTFLLSLSNR